MTLEPGQIIEGKYRIVRLLGEGGMGAVYEGENVSIHRKVAIKILHASVANNTDAVSRFEKEAQAAARIGSDHITDVLDLGTLPAGDRFMVMEFLDGSTLSKRIKDRGRLTPQEAAPLVVQLLEGLTAAHEAHIIHRDLKPDNVYLLKSKAGIKDFVKILDFGISKFNQMSGDSGMSMTRTGAVMGTPYYMSPEQAKGSKEIDARSDLYSVGVILYEAITGQVPFNADTFNELIFKIVLETPPPAEQFVPDLDPGFAAIIRKAMAREQTQRFQNAGEFQQALMSWMQGSHVPMFEESATSAAARGAMASMVSAATSSSGVASSAQPQTPAPWSGNPASDAGSVSTPKKSNAGLIAGLVAVAAIAAAGVGFMVTRKGDAPTDTGAAAPPATAEASARPETKPETKPEAKPEATAEVKPAAPDSSAAPPADSAGDKKAAAPADKGGDKKGGAAAAAPPAAKAGQAAPPPAGPTKAAGGRKIRTEL